MKNEAGGVSALGDELCLEPGRAAFEAWFSEGGKWPASVRRSGNFYVLAAAQSAWTAYKAAWDAHQAEIERLRAELADMRTEPPKEIGDSIRWVLRPSGRTIPDLTGREHVCEWQRALRHNDRIQPAAVAARLE